MAKSRSQYLYCFSPPVMIATCVIESVLFLYTVTRYRLTTLGRLSAVSLASLALFQLAEFNVCGLGPQAAFWSRVGYCAITLLPALGLHMVYEIAGKSKPLIVGTGYGASAAFIGFFGFNSTAFAGHVCAGNYAVFQLASPYGGSFFAYYYILLFAGMLAAWYYARSANARIQEALKLQIIGYLSFMVPTGVVNALNPSTLAGLPSIMCGFAVIYALVLGLKIIPLTLERKDRTKAPTLRSA